MKNTLNNQISSYSTLDLEFVSWKRTVSESKFFEGGLVVVGEMMMKYY